MLLDDIRGRAPDMAAPEPGPGTGVLPLLSHVLDTAWRARTRGSLTMADYEQAGGIERAVADSAKRAYTGLTPARQAAARRVFLRRYPPAGAGPGRAGVPQRQRPCPPPRYRRPARRPRGARQPDRRLGRRHRRRLSSQPERRQPAR
ncbi:MAG: hypothetical protein ACRDN0_04175 [Trebonia sp.]